MTTSQNFQREAGGASAAPSPTKNIDAVFGLTGMGDERQRDIYLRANTFAAHMGIYAGIALAALLALSGMVVWAVVALFATGVPAVAAIAYMKAHGVPYGDSYAQATRTQKIVPSLIGLAIVATMMFGAMWALFTGGPFIEVVGPTTADVAQTASEDRAGTAQTLLIGLAAGVGLTAVLFLVLRPTFLSKRDRRDAADIPDED